MPHNRYFVMRHGESVANAEGKIVSNPDIGTTSFGLTSRGKSQARSSVARLIEQLACPTRILTSDFLRAWETARIAAELTGAPVEVHQELRERYFGDFDGESSDHYESVWTYDRQDADHNFGNVESIQAVVARMVGLTQHLEETTEGETYLLVSHGDPLQILLSFMADGGMLFHRDLAPLENAEIRVLHLRNAYSG